MWWRLFFWYNAVFTVFALVALVPFFLKRDAFLIKNRFPRFALLQAFCTIWLWIVPAIGTSFCVLSALSTRFFGALAVHIGTLRVWALYFRISTAKLKRRKTELFLLSSQTPLLSASAAAEKPSLFERFGFLAQPAVMRFILGGTVALRVVLTLAAVFPDVAAGGGTQSEAPASGLECPEAPVWVWMTSYVLLLLCMLPLAFMAKTVRRFKDNFRLRSELQWYLIAGIAGLVYLLSLNIALLAGAPSSESSTSAVVIALLAQFVYCITILRPLLQQRALDRNVGRQRTLRDERRAAVSKERTLSLERVSTLQGLMGTMKGLGEFRKFLEGEFNEENLEFCEAVDSFKSAYDMKTARENRKQAEMLYDTFVREGSVSEINISYDMRTDITEKMKNAQTAALTRQCTETHLQFSAAAAEGELSESHSIYSNSLDMDAAVAIAAAVATDASDRTSVSILVRCPQASLTKTGVATPQNVNGVEVENGAVISNAVEPPIDPRIFDDAYHELWTLMENDHFLRFQAWKQKRREANLYQRARKSVVAVAPFLNANAWDDD